MTEKKVSKSFKKNKSKSSKQSKSSVKRLIKTDRYTSSGKLKVLPKIALDDIHLSDYGYSLSNPEIKRKSSLKRASKKEGTLKVLRRLNLIRNYTAVEQNKKKMTKDVEYLKEVYNKEKLKK
jgi:hypothetical protein